jgi:hypothetical protein
MTQGLLVTGRRRPTLGALYVAAVGVFAVLLLALSMTGLASPVAVVIVAVPLGPLGLVAAALALPALSTTPSLALAVLVLAGTLAIAAANVMIGAVIAWFATGRLDRIREHALAR